MKRIVQYVRKANTKRLNKFAKIISIRKIKKYAKEVSEYKLMKKIIIFSIVFFILFLITSYYFGWFEFLKEEGVKNHAKIIGHMY